MFVNNQHTYTTNKIINTQSYNQACDMRVRLLDCRCFRNQVIDLQHHQTRAFENDEKLETVQSSCNFYLKTEPRQIKNPLVLQRTKFVPRKYGLSIQNVPAIEV